MSAVLRLANLEISKLAGQFERHSIQTPRWAAERCNEITAHWLEPVRESGAVVIGDLDHLLVDPADFPESPAAPDHVAASSAGALAHALWSGAMKYGDRKAHRAESAATEAELAEVRAKALDALSAGDLVAELRRRTASRMRRDR